MNKTKKRNTSQNKKTNQSNCNSCNNGTDDSNNNSNKETSKLCSFGYVDYIVLASTLAIALGEELDTDDLSILAAFFATFSDELALIASVKSCSSNTPDDIFVPPVPDVAVTRSYNKSKRIKKK